MSELKCNCGRATHTYLSCGPDLPRTPYDQRDELTRLRAESSRLRKALKPIIARLEMPAGGFSRTQDVMIQASELVELQAALSGEDEVR